jgi:asparagine synthetase B (glutamine-hydrolysing)
MPPASVFECEPGGPGHVVTTYAEPFRRPEKLLLGNAAFERALSVFSERVPKYYATSKKTAVSLTGGFDSRTVLAFAPSDICDAIETYTYGVPGCGDLLDAFSIAAALGLSHHGILFDSAFTEALTELIHQTVYLSGGQERINRATLPYVYRLLTQGRSEFPVVVTGISGDHLFRDHIRGKGNVPALISADMMKTIHEGRAVIDSPFFERAFGREYFLFEQHIGERIQWLSERFGTLSIPESYLSYLVYEVAPRYFAGEAAVANNYTQLRSPFWDPEIVRLAYDIDAGTLGFSESLRQKDKYLECVLQARLISSKRKYADLPINGIPIAAYARNSKPLYQFNRFLWRAPKKIKSLVRPLPYRPLENWQYWLNTALASEISKLLGHQAEILRYLSRDFVDEILEKRNTHWLGKIVTAEIVMRLVGRKWSMR